MIRYKEYKRAKSLENAYELLVKSRKNTVIGGMIWLNAGNGQYATVIDLCDLQLNEIEEEEEFFKIGAYVTLRQLEVSERLNAYYSNAFNEAVKHIEGVQLRNLATAGGSVCQRAGFSDLCTLLLAMDAKVTLYKRGTMQVADFLKLDRREKDILINILVPKTAKKVVFLSQRNTHTDLPVLNCGIVKMGTSLRVVVGARPALAELVTVDEEDVQAKLSDEKWIDRFAADVPNKLSFAGNIRASAQYRKMICEVLVRRGLLILKDREDAKNED